MFTALALKKPPATGVPHLTRLAREFAASRHIPYSVHVTDWLIRTDNGDYVFVMKLAGCAFETADDVALNQWHERLNVLWRNIASPQLALWTHLIRRRDSAEPDSIETPGFARRLSLAYQARLSRIELMTNELYLSLVYRPIPHRPTQWAARLLKSADPHAAAQAQIDAVEYCTKLFDQLATALSQYGPRRLAGTVRQGVRFSEPLEFLALLVNGESVPQPLPRAPLAEVLANARLFFGAEAIEYRAATRTRLAGFLGIKEYPHPTVPDMYHRMLTAPFEFVLTQSFSFLSKASSQGLLQAQYNRMRNSGDLALTQAEALKDALDQLTGNEFVMGEHHLSLQVLLDAPENLASASPGERLAALNERIGEARDLLADTGMVVAREDLALEAAFWAQLPGNFPYRPRRAPITSRNFSAMNPLHNFPTGQAADNPWGPALTLLTTRADSPYYFSLHGRATMGATQGESDQAVGHALVCGPTGSGKTVMLGFCISLLQRHRASQVVIDKDRGLEILVRALGGQYLPLALGQPTGMNPLALEPTAANRLFLLELLRQLVQQPGESLSARQEDDLEQALAGALALPPSARRLSRVLEHLDSTDAQGLYPRLARWCEIAAGEFAWVFDNPTDQIVPLLARAATLGFDVTQFLGHARVRTPITMYLFHLIDQMLDGRRFVCWCDEFWRLLDDPAFEQFARDGPKTWRKRNALFVACTQSVSDVLGSAVSRTLIEQIPTQILFPNPQAQADEYIGGFGLSEREFSLIRSELLAADRTFLIRQPSGSVVVRLDLDGLNDELNVISGRSSSIRVLERMLAEHGQDPSDWLEPLLAVLGGKFHQHDRPFSGEPA